MSTAAEQSSDVPIRLVLFESTIREKISEKI